MSRIRTAVLLLIWFAISTQAGSPRLSEDAALDRLLRTLKHDHVYQHRISIDCISFSTEETTHAYFQFLLRENHTPKCGGDPETMPAIDRYRVFRGSKKLERFNPVDDQWEAYHSGLNR